jgi:23S rRNA (guanosine2251-2'-O)-methyltransferase
MNNSGKISVILPNIRSLHNVGSIFRTADAANIEKIYLTGYTGTPADPRIEKVSLGAEMYMKWEKRKYTSPVINKLKKQGYQIVALEQTKKSIDYHKFKPKFPVAVILGHEVAGIKDKWLRRADVHVHLPMMGFKGSLNVSVAWGVFAYYLREFGE